MFTRPVLPVVTALGLFLLTISGLTSCKQGQSADTNSANTNAGAIATAEASTKSAITAAKPTETAAPVTDPTTIPAGKIADPATILSRQQVPVLCYHQIRDWRARDSKSAKDYIVPPDLFKDHMQMLADSGYHTILPDQYYAYLTTGAPLPAKPVMITFDDGDLDQYTVAAPILEKHGFKASFFIMTVAIGRRGYQPYMDKQQIKDLSDRGHTIGAHTWDHHNVKKYQGDDWKIQIDEPNEKLQTITGKPVRYFAYPFGLWNEAALPELKKRGYLMAFTLAEKKRDPQLPLLTTRRIIAGGPWSAKTLYRNMVGSFRQ
ncbi:polysaccharide deacetylase [Fibrisoma limi BUZ 3]|uniref:Polysaccharide deacetylase n=1 Tax=Fibrisoma limi BUZ 3 TaxID=1185876 RepID=I2GE58_9BACT|nr:polysaccharide deacetylase family protein [Fibrisoma limi]CCH52183.1 polysaccharide deacetylase [Fibrisoma limi BUZ 3]